MLMRDEEDNLSLSFREARKMDLIYSCLDKRIIMTSYLSYLGIEARQTLKDHGFFVESLVFSTDKLMNEREREKRKSFFFFFFFFFWKILNIFSRARTNERAQRGVSELDGENDGEREEKRRRVSW